VVSVIAAHAGVSVLAGGFVGVDLFFVLSGFLITQLLIREWTGKGAISLAGFWARRARRLLPASTLVLVATAVATIAFFPATQHKPVSQDLAWSALFAANWRFAQQGTDYFAQDRAISPVQHYWSLGVEEQFYVVWPVLVVLGGLIGAALVRLLRRKPSRGNIRWTVGVLAALVAVVSFAYSVHLTSSDQPHAYFGSPSRAWQLAVGACLAASEGLLGRIGHRVRTVFAIIGLIGFGWAVLALDESGTGVPYPGVVALVPTLAAALLIIAGTGQHGTVVGAALSWRPLVRIGDLSYSLYLWHFPVLVIGISYFEPAGWAIRSCLVAFAFVASWLSYRYVETPVRRLPRLTRDAGLSLSLGALLVAFATSVAIASPHVVPGPTVTGLDGKKVDLGPALVDPMDGLRNKKGDPVCTAVSFDVTDVDSCDFGDVSSDKTVVLVGDSHAATLSRAFDPAATAAGWHLKVWTKPACPIPDVTTFDVPRQTKNTKCDEFRRKIIARTIAEGPDLVVLSSLSSETRRVYDRATGRRLSASASRVHIIEGWKSTIRQFTSRHIPVIVVKEWPIAPEPPADCLTRTREVRKCTFRATTKLPTTESVAAHDMPGVTLLDVDNEFCGPSVCTPVVGNILVYLDRDHFTLRYARHLAPFVRTHVFDRFD
jgi:peptidoglycan/LPS O-acetylase OafA/YrhL